MRLVTTALVMLILLAAVPAGALDQRVWSARYPLLPGGRVSVENVQGDINVEGWDRAAVEVSVIKTAASPNGDVNGVRIDVEFQDRALSLRTIYPPQSNEPVRVDYRLRVPRQVRLERLQTVEGDITVHDLEGAVDTRTLNGNIEQARVAGSVVARALHGNVVVSLRALPDPPSRIYLETVNGNVHLVLPPSANADLQLSTVAGRIESKYIFTVSDVPGDTSWKTRLGRGGVLVRLRTVRGNIRVVESEDLL